MPEDEPVSEDEPADFALYECRDCHYEWHDPPLDGPDAPDCCPRCGSDNIEA